MAFKRNAGLKLFGFIFALSFAMSLLFNAVVQERAEMFKKRINSSDIYCALKRKTKRKMLL